MSNKSTTNKDTPQPDQTKSTAEPQPTPADGVSRPRDLFAELDALNARVAKLEGQQPAPRTQPHMCMKCGGPVTGGVMIGEKHYHAGCAPTGTGT